MNISHPVDPLARALAGTHEKKTRKPDETEPPSTAKPGDTWGAYVLHPDGWWRLNPNWSAAE